MDRSSKMPQGGISFSQPADLSAVVNQNRMKLRVNRVAIVQELKAEHVVGYLARAGVLSPEEMRTVCTETSKPVAVLLDILAQKENRTQWYGHFLTSLKQAEVDLDHRRRYRRLIDFLENTIIRYPDPKPNNFPRYQPLPKIHKKEHQETQIESTTPQACSTFTGHSSTTPHSIPASSATPGEGQLVPYNQQSQQVVPYNNKEAQQVVTFSQQPQQSTSPRRDKSPKKNKEKPEGERGMTLISGHYHKWVSSPARHVSRIADPGEILISLETADDAAFHEQIKAEKLVNHRMKELEVLFLMHRQKRLPKGFILCMADCVTQIVDDTENHHLYVKYIHHLKDNYNLFIFRELVGSFSNWLMATKLGDVVKNADMLHRATKFGLNLFDILCELGEFAQAEAVVTVLTVWLMVQPCLETWMHGYTACVRLARIRIENYEFSEADKSLNSAIQYLNAIKLMSFGQDLVDESEKMVATSWLMHELGSHEAAYHWAHDGLKEVRRENKVGIINALCNGVRCYASKFLLRRAHELAVEAVRQAGEYFGRVHPMFIKARLTYIEFCTEFCPQNEKLLKIAQDTVNRSELLYHCDSMLTARAYLALSDAYISANKLGDGAFIRHSFKAQRMAMNCVNGVHPILAKFADHVAKCTVLKARNPPKPAPAPETWANMKQTGLIFAASELSMAYRVYRVTYGTHSYRAATAQILLADILYEEGNLEDAQTMYEDALSTYNICLRTASPYLNYLKYKLAKFYYERGELQGCLRLLRSVAEHLKRELKNDANRQLMRVTWHDAMLDLYVTSTSDLNDPDLLKAATDMRDSWRRNTELLQPLTLQELKEKPKPFPEFQKSFMLWKKIQAKKVASLGKEMAESEDEKVAPPEETGGIKVTAAGEVPAATK